MTKKKFVLLLISIIASTILILGVSLAIVEQTLESTNQELVLGDIYMHFRNKNQISLSNVWPGEDYENYFEFTISGKNTYTEKDIGYDVTLDKGDVPSGKTEANRIPDIYLKFKLVEVIDGTENVIFTDKSYNDLTDQRIHAETIEKNTTTEINRTYRLYMVVSSSMLIGNIESAVMTSEEYANTFANVNVKVTGDFKETEMSLPASETILKAIEANTTDSCKTHIIEDGITYISGTKDCINFNYVWYSGKLWRITAVYPDGTMKMITDDVITTISYGSNNIFYTDSEKNSYIYQWLNEDFLDTLYNYENIIKTDAKWNVTSGNGTISTKLAETTMVSAKVGLLNSYEYYMSYKNTSYDSGYLNIGYYWWLLNPYNTSSSIIWFVFNDGSYGSNHPSVTIGSRPSIYLKSNIQLEGGTGTFDDPYTIKGDKEEAVANTTLLNTRSSGEYVNVNDELFRIVGTEIVGEKTTTKLNKVDYIRDTSDAVITKAFASTITYGLSTNTQNNNYWDYYLNNTWLKEFDNTYNSETKTSSILEKGIYYIKSSTGGNYKEAVCITASNVVTTKDCEKTTSIWSGYVGLPRYGEMFASQLGSGYNTSSDMWLITPYYYSDIWGVDSNNGSSNYSLSLTIGGRPSINLKSEIIIKSGSGTKSDPFIVGLN